MKLLVSEMEALGGYVSREFFYVMRERHYPADRAWLINEACEVAALLSVRRAKPVSRHTLTLLSWRFR